MKNNTLLSAALLIGLVANNAQALTAPAADASDLFAMTELSSPNVLANHDHGHDGDHDDGHDGDHHCGEGKCGH